MVVGTGVTRKVLYVSTVTIYNRKMLGEQHRFVTKSGINLGRFGVELRIERSTYGRDPVRAKNATRFFSP